MPRFARVVIPGCPHHVTQRGNERRNIFFTTEDRCVYLGLLKQYAELYAVEVLGHCLMTNHVHLVVIPARANALAKLLREVHMRYSQYRHALERGHGHLWQSRYFSCPVDPDRLGAVMRYVELNPVRAAMVRNAGDYAWSSAAAHLGAPDRFEVLSLADWNRCWTAGEWRSILAEGCDAAFDIRDATYSGRPLGSEAFVTRLEGYCSRRLRRGRPGRPKKRPTASARGAGEIGEMSVCPGFPVFQGINKLARRSCANLCNWTC